MEVNFRAVRVEAHDSAGEAPLLVVLDSPAAEGGGDAKKQENCNEQPAESCLTGLPGEVWGKMSAHFFYAVSLVGRSSVH